MYAKRIPKIVHFKLDIEIFQFHLYFNTKLKNFTTFLILYSIFANFGPPCGIFGYFWTSSEMIWPLTSILELGR